MTHGVKGTGRMSLVQTPNHTIKGWGHWWRTQQDLDDYAALQQYKRRARNAGYGDRLEEFRRVETQTAEGLDALKRRERWIKHELTRLKQKYNLPRNTNRTHLMKIAERTGDQDIFNLVNIMTTSTMNDTEKLQRIRSLFLDGKPPAEILYQTALMVGVNLRKKQ